jgi:hypothetical protein
MRAYDRAGNVRYSTKRSYRRHADQPIPLELVGCPTPIHHHHRSVATHQRRRRRASLDRRYPDHTIPVASSEDPQPLALNRQRLTTATVESRMR